MLAVNVNILKSTLGLFFFGGGEKKRFFGGGHVLAVTRDARKVKILTSTLGLFFLEEETSGGYTGCTKGALTEKGSIQGRSIGNVLGY